MDLRDRIRLLLLLLLKQAVKRRKCNNNQSCRTEFATTINSNGLCWILSHALLRCKPLNCAALTAGSGAFLKRNCTRIIRTPVRRKSPKRLVFTQSTMSRKLRCKEQLKSTLASVPRNRGPQFAKRSGRQRVRTFCDAIASTEEPSSYAEKIDLDEGLYDLDLAEPTNDIILADSSPWHNGQHPSALLLPPPPPPAPHQQQLRRQQQPHSFRLCRQQQQVEEHGGSQERQPLRLYKHEHQPRQYEDQLQRYELFGHESWEESREGERVLAMAREATTAGGSRQRRPGSGLDRLPRYKRPAHIDAEYRRRGKIQRGFELVQSLVPALQQTSVNAKQSKASMLTKSAEYIRELSETVENQTAEMEALQKEVESLQTDLQTYQQQLPSNGVNAVERPSCHTERMMEQYLQTSIAQDWKFWIFSFLVRPLSESFMASVSLTTYEEFFRTLHEWSDKHLTLVNLRPIILTLLRSVSTATSIVTDPEKFEQEVHALANCDQKPSALPSHNSTHCCPSTRQ